MRFWRGKLRKLGARNGDIWQYGDAEFAHIGISRYSDINSGAAEKLPEFLSEKVAQIYKEPQKPRLSSDIAAINRGIKVHKFLEHYDASRANIARDLAKQYLRDEALEAEVLAVIARPEFAEIFAKNSMAEVAISDAGELLRIDRLLIGDNFVKIIDFKTGAKNVGAHKIQMQKYASAMARIYPDKRIEVMILWTESLELEIVNFQLL